MGSNVIVMESVKACIQNFRMLLGFDHFQFEFLINILYLYRKCLFEWQNWCTFCNILCGKKRLHNLYVLLLHLINIHDLIMPFCRYWENGAHYFPKVLTNNKTVVPDSRKWQSKFTFRDPGKRMNLKHKKIDITKRITL